MTIMLRFFAAVARAMQFSRAKSAYASSIMTTPLNFAANFAIFEGAANSPVGAFGFVQRKSDVLPAFHGTLRIAASVL